MKLNKKLKNKSKPKKKYETWWVYFTSGKHLARKIITGRKNKKDVAAQKILYKSLGFHCSKTVKVRVPI